MEFALSRSIRTDAEQKDILDFLEENFKSIAETLIFDNNNLVAINIEKDHLLSCNMSTERVTVEVNKKDNVATITTNISYNPTNFFWIGIVLCLIFPISILAPIVLYYSKAYLVVKKKIMEIFDNAERVFIKQ